MSSQNPQDNFGWHEIEDVSLTIQNANVLVQLVARHVLAESGAIHKPAAIGFDVTMDVGSSSSDRFQYSGTHGFYGAIDEIQEELRSLKLERQKSVQFGLVGFVLDFHLVPNTRHPTFCLNAQARRSNPEEELFARLEQGIAVAASDLECSPCAFRSRVALIISSGELQNFIDDVTRLSDHLNLFAP